jgi:hypothetical protein
MLKKLFMSFCKLLGKGLLGLFLISPLHAALVTFSFDPNDLIDGAAATANKADLGSRALLGDFGNVASTLATTYANPNGAGLASPQPSGANTYFNWLQGLGPGEGIAAFNVWMRGDQASLVAWGQELKMAGENPGANSTIFGFAPALSGWSVNTALYSPSADAFIFSWFTTDPGQLLRPGGVDLPLFSFTADVVVDPGAGPDQPVIDGATYRVWFGGSNSPGFSSILFDSIGWGSLAPSLSPFAQSDSSAWQGALDLEAVVVPEPGSFTLVVAVAVLASWLRRRRAEANA